MKYGNTPIVVKGRKFRSKLEATCNELLIESGLSFDYESLTFVLLDKFQFPTPSYERIGKTFKNSQAVRAVKYLPDFIVHGQGTDYLIETKGFLTPVARLKWKLLKSKIVEEKLKLVLFMPTNKTEIKQTINIIKTLEDEIHKTRKEKRSRTSKRTSKPRNTG